MVPGTGWQDGDDTKLGKSTFREVATLPLSEAQKGVTEPQGSIQMQYTSRTMMASTRRS